MGWRADSKFISQIGAGLSIRVLSLLASFASSVVLVRFLGPENYGIYALVLAVVAFLTIPTLSGLPTLVLREIAANSATKNWTRVRGIGRWAYLFILSTSFGISVIGTALLVTGLLPVQDKLHLPLLIGLLFVPLMAFSSLNAVILRAFHWVFWSQFPEQVARPVLLAAAVTAIFVFNDERVTAETALVAQFVVLLTVVGISLLLVRRVWPASAVSQQPDMAHRKWLRALLPLSMITGFQLIYNNSDLLMIGVLKDTTSLGTYRIALSIATLITAGTTAVNLVAMPHYAAFHGQNNWDEITRTSRHASLCILITTVFPTVVFLFFGEWFIVTAYGEEQRAAFLPTIMLSIGLCFYGAWSTLGGVLIMIGEEKSSLLILMVTVLSNVILNLILIPPYGIEGAAVATGISYFAHGISLRVITGRILNERQRTSNPQS